MCYSFLIITEVLLAIIEHANDPLDFRAYYKLLSDY